MRPRCIVAEWYTVFSFKLAGQKLLSMPRIQAAADFIGRHPTVGPWLWVASLQYYLVQIVAASAWHTAYSIRSNFISDLGNTACRPSFGGVYVCSPLHNLMNVSFVVLGTTISLGAVFMCRRLRSGPASLIGFGLIAVSGINTVAVGLFPENSVAVVHSINATMGLICINAGVAALYYSFKTSKAMSIYSLASGTVGLTALLFFGLHIYFGIGKGDMERIADYLPTLWLIVCGIFMLKGTAKS